MTDQYKRNVAYKLRIGDLFIAKPIIEGEKFLYLELGDRKISRVNVVGNIVDKYDAEGDKEYIFFTLDDGSGQIKLKIFGEDSIKIENTQDDGMDVFQGIEPKIENFNIK